MEDECCYGCEGGLRLWKRFVVVQETVVVEKQSGCGEAVWLWRNKVVLEQQSGCEGGL